MPASSRGRCPALPAVLVAAMAVAGCSNGKFVSNPVVDYALKTVGYGEQEAPTPQTQVSIGQPLLVGYGAIRVAIPSVGRRGQSRYFVAPDGVEIATNEGFVTRVIGLGIDLQGMYLPVDSPYLGDFVGAARESAVTQRVAEYYRKGRITRDSYRCDLSFEERDGRKGIVNERCRRVFGDSGFLNRYWVDDGRIVCSTQWFNPDGDVLQFFETAEQATSLDLRTQDC